MTIGWLSINTRESGYTAVARLSHRNSVRPSVGHTGGSVKNGASYNHQIFNVAAGKIVSGLVKLFYKFEKGPPIESVEWKKGKKILRFLANKSLYLRNGAR